MDKWFVLLLVLIAVSGGFICGRSAHDCPVTIEYRASDTIPPVTAGFVIEDDSVKLIAFTAFSVELSRDTIYERPFKFVDSAVIRRIKLGSYIRVYDDYQVIGTWHCMNSLYRESYDFSNVYPTRELACRELDRRLAEMQKKAEEVVDAIRQRRENECK